jgi:uncharacterized protein YqeY
MLEKIKEDMKNAMKSGEKEKLVTIRMLLSDIHKKEIDKRGPLTEQEILGVVSKSIKSRKDSIEEFKRGDRDDLVQKESREIEYLNVYLPKPLSKEEIQKAIEDIITETGASSAKDFGRVMKEIMGRYQGQVDGKEIGEIIKQKLG